MYNFFGNFLIWFVFVLCDVILFLKGDVYPVESNADFSVNQVLDAHWGVLNDEDVRNLVTAYV